MSNQLNEKDDIFVRLLNKIMIIFYIIRIIKNHLNNIILIFFNNAILFL
jgi:hypothetical protein